MARTESDTAAFDEVIAAIRGSGLDFAAPPVDTRAAFEAIFAEIPVAAGSVFTQNELSDVAPLVAALPGAAEDAALLYLHGGGFTAGAFMRNALGG